MAKLRWYQRIFTREVVGKITGKQLTHKGLIKQAVTLYTITQKDETVHRGALPGHHGSPELGDIVEMYLGRCDVIAKDTVHITQTEADGTKKVISKEIEWEKIKSYKILEDLVKYWKI